jgi:hypothetical protein
LRPLVVVSVRAEKLFDSTSQDIFETRSRFLGVAAADSPPEPKRWYVRISAWRRWARRIRSNAPDTRSRLSDAYLIKSPSPRRSQLC